MKKEMTISDLASGFDEIMIDGKAKGFTIGKGKKLYWFITPMPSGYYRCLGYEKNNLLGWPRIIEVNQRVIVHYAE